MIWRVWVSWCKWFLWLAVVHWMDPRHAFIYILLWNATGRLWNTWKFLSSLLIAVKVTRNQTSRWTLITLQGWHQASFLPLTCERVASCLLTPSAFNLPLPVHVNTTLILAPLPTARRPLRSPYFRLNNAVATTLTATKIKDVAKESYKTRRFTLFLFDLFCSTADQRP